MNLKKPTKVSRVKLLILLMLVFIGLTYVSLWIIEGIEYLNNFQSCPKWTRYDTSLNCCCNEEWDGNCTSRYGYSKILCYKGCWC